MTAQLNGNVKDQNGLPVSGALIYVYDQPGGLADLTDSLGQPAVNPVVADEDGYWAAYAENDRYYTLKYYWGGRQRYVEANVLLGEVTLGIQTDPNLRTDLAADSGAGLVKYKLPATGAVGRTQESRNRDRISVMDFIPVAHHAAIRDRTSTQDVTSYIQAALEQQETATFGSFEVSIPDGTYCITGSGARILEIPRGIKLVGDSLEGTRFKVLPGSTSATALEDDGSAAKIEIYNLTIDGNGNTSLTAGLKLGHRGIQFGTWGCLDNITVRGMPNATAVMLNCNIVQCGKIYTLETKDGLISSGAGSGLHIETFTPTAFSGIGLQLALSDSVNFYEAEAMTSNDAIPIFFNRGGAVANFFMSVAPGTQIKTPVKVNSTYVDDFYLGQSIISLFDATAKWGDTTNPDDSGTATSADPTSLTISSKNWGRGQWTGAVIHITGGTGVGQMRRIASNSKTKINIVGSWATVPDATSTFALSYFVRTYDDAGVSTGGYAASDTFTFGKPAARDLTVTNQLTANQMLLGKSADAQPIKGIMKVVATLDFPSVAAGGVQALTVNVEGAQTSMPVTLGVPSALQSVAGMAYSAAVSAAGVVSVYAKNSTAGAIDPASGTFVVQVFDY